MILGEKNYAYIDGANLHKGVKNSGWNLDYKKFRVWLKEKYGARQAYLFIGFVPKNKDLYTYLQECGFILVYKDITYGGDGCIKGNCDADLVLHAIRDAYENNFEKAILVSSDGDYAGLVKFLQEKKKFAAILSPSLPEKCSILLKRTSAPIAYLIDKKSILAIKEKTPDADGTA
ncbi:MAG: NYN domain-containing protein [Candidatus Magasanikbacteria bacterium]|nr:NYN domain-containing protein [Candidatus Magasanikbacteria bacterium]